MGPDVDICITWPIWKAGLEWLLMKLYEVEASHWGCFLLFEFFPEQNQPRC